MLNTDEANKRRATEDASKSRYDFLKKQDTRSFLAQDSDNKALAASDSIGPKTAYGAAGLEESKQDGSCKIDNDQP